jgi:hypothetical protein
MKPVRFTQALEIRKSLFHLPELLGIQLSEAPEPWETAGGWPDDVQVAGPWKRSKYPQMQMNKVVDQMHINEERNTMV